MTTKDLDSLHEERVEAAIKLWESDDRGISPEKIFISERVIKTIGSDKIFLPSYNKEKLLASAPFAPITYVVLCPGCIIADGFDLADFQKFARSQLVMPVLLAPYKMYPEKLVEFLLSVDHVSCYEFHAYRDARLVESSARQICQHCAGEKIKTIVSAVGRRRNSNKFREKISWLESRISPFLYPDYTLLDEAAAACKDRDLARLKQLTHFAETIYSVRSAQALDAPVTIDDDALDEIPAGVTSETDEVRRLLTHIRKLISNGLGLKFPSDIPLDRYLELAKDYQPSISGLIEYAGGGGQTSIDELSKRINSLNAEIERIQGLKRYVVLEASITALKQHKDIVFATILAGTLGLGGAGWLGCGAAALTATGLRAAKNRGLFAKMKNEPAERLGRMVIRDLHPYLSKLIAAYVGSSPIAVNVLMLRKRIRESMAA